MYMLSQLSIFFRKSPFMRLVLALLMGFYIAPYLSLSHFLILSLLTFGAYCFIVIWQRKHAVYKYRHLSGIAGVLMYVSLAAFYAQLRQPVQVSVNEACAMDVRVLSGIGSSAKNNKYEVRAHQCANDTLGIRQGMKGIVYISKLHDTLNIVSGQRLYLSGRFLPFTPPDGPFDFDYSQYLKNQRIAFRFVAREAKLYDDDTLPTPIIISERVKNYLRKRYVEAGLDEAQGALLNALYLGDKSRLSYEQKSAFSDAGAMHLLAVSGLHVGIIYLLLVGGIGALGIPKDSGWVALFIIFCLWFYALITGFSPSVLRSGLMFTILEVGRISRQKTGIFNLLGASMFIILLIEPLSVYNVGFWLSHCAVASIVSFYPKINKWFYFRFPPFRWLWSIAAVSLAAQVGTLPLSIHTFNEFPLYFMLTNLLLIPVVTPILILAVLSSLFSFCDVCLKLMIPALGDLLTYIEGVALSVDRLPFSSLTNLYIDRWQMYLFYGFLILFLLYSDYRFLRYLKYLTIMLIAFLFSFHLRAYYQPAEVVYIAKVRDKSVVNYFTQQQNIIYADGIISDKDIEFAFKGVWARYGAPATYSFSIIDATNNKPPPVLNPGGKSMVLLPANAQWSLSKQAVQVDYLVLMGQPRMSLDEVLKTVHTRLIIIPTGWKWYQRKWYAQSAMTLDYLHDVYEEGAFLLTAAKHR
ncbi:MULTISPECIES: ComEC/Rec2 family competence protein [unclassified Carboxylicivirga]|uniref:ComEC/Rec2 family competence protein n=1 Tax=Carboxylicivirga TaxID=1628153 RepID=UPI003D34292E